MRACDRAYVNVCVPRARAYVCARVCVCVCVRARALVRASGGDSAGVVVGVGLHSQSCSHQPASLCFILKWARHSGTGLNDLLPLPCAEYTLTRRGHVGQTWVRFPFRLSDTQPGVGWEGEGEGRGGMGGGGATVVVGMAVDSLTP